MCPRSSTTAFSHCPATRTRRPSGLPSFLESLSLERTGERPPAGRTHPRRFHDAGEPHRENDNPRSPTATAWPEASTPQPHPHQPVLSFRAHRRRRRPRHRRLGRKPHTRHRHHRPGTSHWILTTSRRRALVLRRSHRQPRRGLRGSCRRTAVPPSTRNETHR